MPVSRPRSGLSPRFQRRWRRPYTPAAHKNHWNLMYRLFQTNPCRSSIDILNKINWIKKSTFGRLHRDGPARREAHLFLFRHCLFCEPIAEGLLKFSFNQRAVYFRPNSNDGLVAGTRLACIPYQFHDLAPAQCLVTMIIMWWVVFRQTSHQISHQICSSPVIVLPAFETLRLTRVSRQPLKGHSFGGLAGGASCEQPEILMVTPCIQASHLLIDCNYREFPLITSNDNIQWIYSSSTAEALEFRIIHYNGIDIPKGKSTEANKG